MSEILSEVESKTRAARHARWLSQLKEHQTRLDEPPALIVEGKLNRMVGLTLEAVGCQAAIGARCIVDSPGSASIEAEVVGFANESLYLMPTSSMQGIRPNARGLLTPCQWRSPE